MLPVIFLNLYYTGSFHTCEITSLNIALQRNNMHIKNIKFPSRTMKPTNYWTIIFQQKTGGNFLKFAW